MSYSFNVRAATKAEAIAKITQELDNVVAGQPMHSVDRAQALAVAETYLEILPADPGDQQISVSMSGSLGWRAGDVITSASVNVAVGIVPK